MVNGKSINFFFNFFGSLPQTKRLVWELKISCEVSVWPVSGCNLKLKLHHIPFQAFIDISWVVEKCIFLVKSIENRVPESFSSLLFEILAVRKEEVSISWSCNTLHFLQLTATRAHSYHPLIRCLKTLGRIQVTHEEETLHLNRNRPAAADLGLI